MCYLYISWLWPLYLLNSHFSVWRTKYLISVQIILSDICTHNFGDALYFLFSALIQQYTTYGLGWMTEIMKGVSILNIINRNCMSMLSKGWSECYSTDIHIVQWTVSQNTDTLSVIHKMSWNNNLKMITIFIHSLMKIQTIMTNI